MAAQATPRQEQPQPGTRQPRHPRQREFDQLMQTVQRKDPFLVVALGIQNTPEDRLRALRQADLLLHEVPELQTIENVKTIFAVSEDRARLGMIGDHATTIFNRILTSSMNLQIAADKSLSREIRVATIENYAKELKRTNLKTDPNYASALLAMWVYTTDKDDKIRAAIFKESEAFTNDPEVLAVEDFRKSFRNIARLSPEWLKRFADTMQTQEALRTEENLDFVITFFSDTGPPENLAFKYMVIRAFRNLVLTRKAHGYRTESHFWLRGQLFAGQEVRFLWLVQGEPDRAWLCEVPGMQAAEEPQEAAA